MENTTQTFRSPYPLKTAVLFMVFNRLDTTKQVFEAIQKAKPPKLYIAADGARNNKEGESEKVKSVRDFILKNIDWQCEIKTLFREKNLGCKYAVSSAITWFFENEEMGIILEDDCLPSQSFFWFCEELLELYKEDMRVWHIGGSNFQNGIRRGEADYYYSKYNHVWGWASWSKRWKFYDVELNNIKDSGFIKSTFSSKLAIRYWNYIYKKVKAKKIDTWDYQWTFTIWLNNGLAILPSVNMITNIGFGDDATHTKSDEKVMENFELTITSHPSQIILNRVADDYTFKHHYIKKSFIDWIANKLKRYFNAV
jgi:hypothetical protein